MTTAQPTPFLSGHLLRSSEVPIILPILTGVYCLMTSLIFVFCGSFSVRWGPSWKLFGLGEERWLKGGVGGALAGLGGMATISIFLTLLIPSHTSLSPLALYLILACTGMIGLILGGRFKWVGRFWLASSGAISLTFILLLTSLPKTLLPRLILLLSLIVISLSTTFLPPLLPSVFPTSLPSKSLIVFTSLGIGSFLFGFSVDLFMPSGKGLGWIDCMGLIVGEDLKNGKAIQIQDWEDWRKETFRGLLSACWILGFLGIGFQFWRLRVVGDDPDEKWNSYLGNLINQEKQNDFLKAREGNKSVRGVFEPEPSIWEKFSNPFNKISNNKSMGNSPFVDKFNEKVSSPLTELPSKKNNGIRSPRSPNKRHLPWEESSELISDEEDDLTLGGENSKPPARFDPYRKLARMETLVGSDLDLGTLNGKVSGNYKSVRSKDGESDSECDEEEDSLETGTLVESLEGVHHVRKIKEVEGLGIGGIKIGVDERPKVMKKKSISTSPEPIEGSPSTEKMMTSTPLIQQKPSTKTFNPLPSPSSNSSDSEEGEDQVGDLERGVTKVGKKKGMVASISKMFEGKKQPAKYNGSGSPPSPLPLERNGSDKLRRNSYNVGVGLPSNEEKRVQPGPTTGRKRTMSADFSSRISRFQSPNQSSISSNSSSSSSNQPEPVVKKSNEKVRNQIAAAVPATPSLINALERVKEAQRQAREALSHNHNHDEDPEKGLEIGDGEEERFENVRGRESGDWWREVEEMSKK